jgi:hypothetical protein
MLALVAHAIEGDEASQKQRQSNNEVGRPNGQKFAEFRLDGS